MPVQDCQFDSPANRVHRLKWLKSLCVSVQRLKISTIRSMRIWFQVMNCTSELQSWLSVSTLEYLSNWTLICGISALRWQSDATLLFPEIRREPRVSRMLRVHPQRFEVAALWSQKWQTHVSRANFEIRLWLDPASAQNALVFWSFAFFVNSGPILSVQFVNSERLPYQSNRQICHVVSSDLICSSSFSMLISRSSWNSFTGKVRWCSSLIGFCCG